MSGTDTGGGISRVVPDVVRRRFVRKYFGIVVVAMLLTAVVGVALGASATATLNGQVEQQVASTAGLQADSLEGWIDGLRHQTRTISEAPPFQTGRTDGVAAYLLNRLQNARSDIVAIHYVKSSDATVVESTEQGMSGTDLQAAGVPWATRTEEIDATTDTVSTVVVADTPYESATDETVVAFISAPPQNTEHVVVVEAALSAGGAFQQTTEGAFTTVHNGDESLVYGQDHADAPVPDGAIGSESTGVAALSGSVVGYAPVEGTDWTVATHVPSRQAYALRDQLLTTIAALVLVPLVVLGAATAVFGRRTGSALERLTKKAERMEDGDLDVTFDRQRADEIGRLTAAFGNMQAALKEEIATAERAREKAEVSRAEAVAMNDYLQERADEYSEILARCAAGDLTVRMDPDGENDAMDRIAADFNETLSELEKTTGQLKRFAEEVAETGETIESSAYSLQDASEQIAESIQTVSIDTDDQRAKLQAATEEMDAAAAALERHADERDIDVTKPIANVERAAATLSDVAEGTDQTTAEAETVAGAAEEQAAELTEVTQQADKLRRYATPLGDVLGRFKTDAEREFYFPSGPGNVEDAPAPEE
ncbi:HAMP domain-containing protein [Haloarcula pellucida]|uniref:HAMP domain-containing protein n=1 Tax=Haloarcula pellucida TaxID=1427151 RepID=A0A830GJX5_9EURY|nr:HAMP domain-containing protein [Halomicroarcula pellucida]MBX0350406.1 HAMP domain-containing protein [Halomicroarcula pellucida]GGN90834.1 hypothetical protein GCM10009030_13200 [Halomicroarcula pellucida]